MFSNVIYMEMARSVLIKITILFLTTRNVGEKSVPDVLHPQLLPRELEEVQLQGIEIVEKKHGKSN